MRSTDAFTAAAVAMRRELSAAKLSDLVADGLSVQRGVGTSGPP